MSNFQRTIMADIGRAKQLWLSALFLAREAIYTQSAVMCHVPAEGRFLFFFFLVCVCDPSWPHLRDQVFATKLNLL